MTIDAKQDERRRHTNRLINETSTYLLQHAHNPVDWYPWGQEALQRARQEDKPILLSVGYSACHWCHVMEHESFEDETTARLMNDTFVCIKVDREERPDIDDIYMKAVQMLTGHGGWPMTVFLTSDLQPFFAGTYFPPEDRHGMPSFKRVLAGVTTAWKEQRDSVDASAAEITSHLSLFDKVPAGDTKLQYGVIENSAHKLWHALDKEWGGLGSAPKFPHSSALTFCTLHAAANAATSVDATEHCHEVVTKTLDHMAFGGMYDQLGGGFCRYSTDRLWLIPHFEKMLYDNAQLCRNYLQGYQLTGNRYWAQVAAETLEFVLREMTTGEGVFYSSLDADSEGVEGKYYVWNVDEIKAVLGDEPGAWFCRIYGVTAGGNFEHEQNVLHLTDSPDALAAKDNLTTAEFWRKLNPLRSKLLAAREQRVRPGRDEKVLVSWNSLMISAFTDGYRILGESKYLAVARRATQFILDRMMKDGRLLRTWGRGKAKLDAYLDDYAYFVEALLDLASVDFDPTWLAQAVALNQVVLDRFSDATEGGFYYTSNEHERLITRTKSFYDTSTPSPTAVATMNLIKLSVIFGRDDWREHATRIMKLYAPFFEKLPDQFSSFLCALEYLISEITEIVLVADPAANNWWEMLFAIHKRLIPNCVVVMKDASSSMPELQAQSPLLAQRSLMDGQPAAYICRNYTCQAPITQLDELEQSMHKLGLVADQAKNAR